MKDLSQILKNANGRARTRTINESEARSLIALAQAKVKELPAKLRRRVVFQYADGVPNAYRYAGESTHLEVEFDYYGKVREVRAFRAYAPKKPYGDCQRRLLIVRHGDEKIAGFPGGYMQI